MEESILEVLGRESGLRERVEAVLEDPRLQRILAINGSSPNAVRQALDGGVVEFARAVGDRRAVVGSIVTGEAAPTPPSDLLFTEAIIELTRRPVYLVKNDRIDVTSALSPFERNITAEMAGLGGVLRSTGRVEFLNHRMTWGGSAWLIEEDLIVTNRHVAELVAEADGKGGYGFSLAAPGVLYGARIDFLEEHGSGLDRTVEVKGIEYLAPSDGPDIALLRLQKPAGTPLVLARADPRKGALVGVIGYPANNSNNDASAIAAYFGAIFDKKRFAPGYVTQEAGLGGRHFLHDCTTLNGNSGSVVVDLTTREAIGLHYAGQFKTANFAVPADLVRRAAKGLKVIVSGFVAETERPDAVHPREALADRPGYDPSHLGPDLPLPGFEAHADAVADVTEADGAVSKTARYRHFSVVHHQERRMPLFTAVNIDGAQSRKIKRGDDIWFSDLRLDAAVQLNNGHYSHPDIDRGHMVRREDPNWGDDAQQANDDTFHYCNAAPQHAKLNQGKQAWLGLEDYVLGAARTQGFRVSVFTGPILSADDRVIETRSGPLQLPEEFWKVVVALDAETGDLRATGYVLGQGAYLDHLEGVGFAYGQYGAFQVSVASIEEATGLDFHGLAQRDPLAQIEGPGTRVRRLLRTAEEALL